MKTAEKKHSILNYLSEHHIRAAIFDLDGTLLDNNPYHLISWLEYLKEKNIHITQEEFDRNMSGRTNKDAIEYIFQRKMDDGEIRRITEEKEEVYRRIYKPHIRPINGLLPLLNVLKAAGINMAIATSGIQPNIDFMFEHVPIKPYFSAVVNSSHIKEGKPHPEIYITTAGLLGIPPQECVVFEDSIPGVTSALRAGMRVIAITTTLKANAFSGVDLAISDYRRLF
ncbi:MAG: HAD family phosphatase [Chitinophagaceae bacterium]|nr:HAD family phosphatase [Chitinophagaceae bacterium]